jgi:nicotinamide-nucleotide amidase
MTTEKLPSAGEDLAEKAACCAALLHKHGIRIAVAESCTGGLLAKLLTDLPGSSAYFRAGVIAYSNDAKAALLGVPPSMIELNGAVSAEVAEAMAAGMRRIAGSDLALSVTGIAGPDGGTAEKPVGTVYLGLADSSGGGYQLLRLSGDRLQVRAASAGGALDWLTEYLHSSFPDAQR